VRDECALESFEHIRAECTPPGKVDGNAVRGLAIAKLEEPNLINKCAQTCAFGIDGNLIARRHPALTLPRGLDVIDQMNARDFIKTQRSLLLHPVKKSTRLTLHSTAAMPTPKTIEKRNCHENDYDFHLSSYVPNLEKFGVHLHPELMK